MLFFFLCFLAVIALIVGIVFCALKMFVTVGKVLILLSTGFGLTIITLILSLILAFAFPSSIFYIISMILFDLFLMSGLISFLFKRNKRFLRIIVVLLILILLVNGGKAGVDVKDKFVPTMPEYDVMYEFSPYREDSKIYKLKDEVSLKIEEEFPIMDGATALYPIYASIAKAVYPKDVIEDYNNDVLNCTKTIQAYKNIVDGKADIIFVAGPSKEQEQYAKDNNVELIYTPIGKEAFVFFVNSKNKLDNISLDEIQGIYSGEITEWKQLGVKRLGEIVPFQRPAGSGSQTALEKMMGDKEIIEPITEEVVALMEGIIDKTADYKNYKNAIGYSFRFYSTEMVKNKDIKLLSINGVEPSKKNIENSTYPITSEFYAVIRSDASENTQELLKWITSSQGQKIIEEVGYVPIN